MTSRLFYYGTSTEVELGDRVHLTRILRRPKEGTVCYIPGLSEPHSELEYEDIRQWAVRSDDGCVYPILYSPETFQPPKNIKFVSHGSGNLLEPDEHLE